MITGKLYDRLKFLAQIGLPALGTAYFALAGIWGLPAAEQVVGTIVVIDTFLGTILQLSAKAYAKSDDRFDGSMAVRTVGDKQTFQMEFNDEKQLEKLGDKREILFKVNRE